MSEEVKIPQQRYKWTKKKVFDTFNEADTLRKKLIDLDNYRSVKKSAKKIK